MKKTILILLIGILMLPSAIFSQSNRDKKRKKKIVKKTASVSKIKRKPAPKVVVPKVDPYEAARPTGVISPEVEAFLKLPPPKDKYVFPKTKDSLMTRLTCSEGKYMWISTENSLFSFVGTAIRLDYGLLKAMAPDATYQNVSDVVMADSSAAKDVQFAKKIIASVNPKELVINTSNIQLEKVGLKVEDTKAVLGALQDHLGDEVEVRVSSPSECFLTETPAKTIASKSG